MARFAFGQQIARMAEKNRLYQVVKAFCDPKIDLAFPGLTPAQANIQMGYVFEELIRIGAEQSNEEAGEHFTPREVIKLMVNLLLSPHRHRCIPKQCRPGSRGVQTGCVRLSFCRRPSTTIDDHRRPVGRLRGDLNADRQA